MLWAYLARRKIAAKRGAVIESTLKQLDEEREARELIYEFFHRPTYRYAPMSAQAR